MHYSPILDRLKSKLWLKLALTIALNLWVYVPYHFLQHHAFFPVIIMPASYLDRLIPFSEYAVWAYLSIYLLMPVGPFLMHDKRQIVNYAWGIIVLGFLADIVFFIWPTSCPRPLITSENPVYHFLTQIDMPRHALPSLHAAFAVYSALCAELVLREFGRHPFLRVGIWLWTLTILYATLATKQHVMADILAGSAMALGTYICVFRSRESSCHAIASKPS